MSPRILVADDEKGIRAALGQLLEYDGYDVHSVANAVDAIADQLDILVRVLAADRKRIHAAFDFYCARYPDPVALGEMMLLHVRQDPSPSSIPFPPAIMSALEALVASTSAVEPPGPPSRRIELRVR